MLKTFEKGEIEGYVGPHSKGEVQFSLLLWSNMEKNTGFDEMRERKLGSGEAVNTDTA